MQAVHRVEYDDGDVEQEDLLRGNFHFLEDSPASPVLPQAQVHSHMCEIEQAVYQERFASIS